MERNDVDCRKCGTSIFNGCFLWMFTYAYRCKEFEKELDELREEENHDTYIEGFRSLKHKVTRSQDFNGYFFCPECAEELGYKCDVCGSELIKVDGY